jgi:hypothetical protein
MAGGGIKRGMSLGDRAPFPVDRCERECGERVARLTYRTCRSTGML